MNNVFYVNTFNDPNKLSDDRFLVVWEVELVNFNDKYGRGNYKFVKKLYDKNNKLKAGEIIDPDNILITYGKKSLIVKLFEYWRERL